MSIIYKITNLINGKIYIGQHYTSADDGYLGSGKWIKRAIKKYGKENFIRETIEFCTSANVDEKEVYWVNKLGATNPKVGYNIDKGGTGRSPGYKHSKETKEKLRQINLQREIKPEWIEKFKKVRKGYKHKEKTKNKISIKHKGIKHSEETKKLLSLVFKGLTKKKWTKKRKEQRIKETIENNKSKSKFSYILSNNEDFWQLNKKQRFIIKRQFQRKNTDIIVYKGITIERHLKNENFSN